MSSGGVGTSVYFWTPRVVGLAARSHVPLGVQPPAEKAGAYDHRRSRERQQRRTTKPGCRIASQTGTGGGANLLNEVATEADAYHFKRLTARAMTRPSVTRAMADCRSINILAHTARGMASVGLNAVALVNDTYR